MGTDDATLGMKRSGYYDSHSEYQQAVAATGAELIEASIAAVPLPAPERSFVIVDYGSSTGASSIKMVTVAVAAIRDRRADVPVAVIHNDVPTNDFNQLFANLRDAPDGYLGLAGPPVVPLASAASFFGPVAPAASVGLGLSFSAAHWLRAQPDLAVPEGFSFSAAVGPTRDALRTQADDDWADFLRARAVELEAGGRLVVQMVGTTEAGEVTADRLLAAMAAVAGTMADDGALDPRAVERYVLPVYARTPTEARRPLDEDPRLHEAFAVHDVRTDPVANPYLDQWRKDGDRTAYAASYAAFVRGFTESSLRLHLFGADPPDGLVDDYFARLEARFAADPEADAFDDWTLTVVLERTAGG
jgi:hypothetical protein